MLLLPITQCWSFFFFFFQAEDGIRDYKVTGVQTCALPIWLPSSAGLLGGGRLAEGEMPAAPPDLTRIGSPAGTLRTASACCSTAGRSSARSPQPGYKSRAARSDRVLGTVGRGRRPGPLSEKPARNQQLRGIRGKSYIKHKPCIMFYLPASSPEN